MFWGWYAFGMTTRISPNLDRLVQRSTTTAGPSNVLGQPSKLTTTSTHWAARIDRRPSEVLLSDLAVAAFPQRLYVVRDDGGWKEGDGLMDGDESYRVIGVQPQGRRRYLQLLCKSMTSTA